MQSQTNFPSNIETPATGTTLETVNGKRYFVRTVTERADGSLALTVESFGLPSRMHTASFRDGQLFVGAMI
jgi:hypothetical protein